MSIVRSGTTLTFNDGTTQASAAKIINVAQGALTGTVYIASSSFVDVSGLSVSITPKTTSSRVLVFVNLMYSSSDNGYNFSYTKQIRVTRNGTAIGVGDNRGAAVQSWGGQGLSYSYNYAVPFEAQWMDSPATTSSCTYQVQLLTADAQPTIVGGSYNYGNYYNQSNISTITVLEVA
jgi:hypothetical protein